ncbi:hypothetical protein QUF54_05965 [Candidatus Marithioploca araucensis]|uniref:Uncharacterized protein n=1 Tax=Candidatus Marithioploca araucensis TaxID=70273 RepID=A0ABT7VTK0_9GAMM|nr:hypothetical protein [Candidatus Marithioploca araucensis]
METHRSVVKWWVSLMDENEGEHAGFEAKSFSSKNFSLECPYNQGEHAGFEAKSFSSKNFSLECPYSQGEHVGSPLQSGRTRRFAPTEIREVL